MTNQSKYLFFFLCLFLIFGNVIMQISMQKSGLDNKPVNIYNPTSYDAFSYVKKAKLVAKHGDFVSAFKDGYRLPGYPLFLSIFYHFSDRPLLVARYAQIVLSALTILFSYLALVNIFRSRLKAIIGASVITLWLPFYYFSPILYAEICSIFLFALFFLTLSNLTHEKPTFAIYTLPILLALLVYLKPNHIFLFVPLLAFLLFKIDGLTLRHLFAVSVLFIIMLIPWTAFVSVMNDNIIPLSTTSGINLYSGTGVNTDQEDQSAMGSVSLITARKLGLRDEHIIGQTQRDIQSMTVAEKNTYLTNVAKIIWISRPIKTTLYGLGKIFHGFGFSFRDFRDVILVMLFISSIAFSIYLWASHSHREWCVFFWAILFVASLQMFIFLPNQRFVTVIFHLPAMMMIIIGVFQLFECFFKIPSQLTPTMMRDKNHKANENT